MIVIYPMIVSKSVNPNVLPGVCKALEKYLIVNKMDKIVDNVNKQAGSKKEVIKLAKGKLTMESVEEIQEDRPKGSTVGKKGTTATGTRGQSSVGAGLPGTSSGQRAGGRTVSAQADAEGGKGGMAWSAGGAGGTGHGGLAIAVAPTPEKPKERPPEARATARFDTKIDSRAITVEPTTISIDTVKGTLYLGIKVVPYIVNNDTSLIRLLMNDRYRSKASANVQWQTRRILKMMWGFANRFWKYTVGLFHQTGLVGQELYTGTLTGDWKKDVIIGTTKFDKNLFILVNQTDLKSDFLYDASKVKRLFKLMWPSLMVADEVNQRMHFCMDEYKGMCSVVNYGYLYALSRETVQAYEKITDVQRSAASVFRMKGRLTNMIRDDIAYDKYLKYSRVNLVSESVGSPIVSRVMKDIKSAPKKYKQIFNDMLKASQRRDMKGLMSSANKLGKFTIDFASLQPIMRAVDGNYDRVYKFTDKVFANSLPEIPSALRSAGASFLAFASLGADNPMSEVKKNIKKVVVDTRKSMKKKVGDEDFDREMMYAFVFGIISTGIVAAAAVAIIPPVVSFVASITGTISWIVTIAVLAIASVTVLSIFQSLGFIPGGK